MRLREDDVREEHVRQEHVRQENVTKEEELHKRGGLIKNNSHSSSRRYFTLIATSKIETKFDHHHSEV